MRQRVEFIMSGFFCGVEWRVFVYVVLGNLIFNLVDSRFYCGRLVQVTSSDLWLGRLTRKFLFICWHELNCWWIFLKCLEAGPNIKPRVWLSIRPGSLVCRFKWKVLSVLSSSLVYLWILMSQSVRVSRLQSEQDFHRDTGRQRERWE